MKVLIIDMNAKENSLFSKEFISPITDILDEEVCVWQISSYKELPSVNLAKFEKIILSGNQVMDKGPSEEERKKYFSWLLTAKNDILGICAGAQVLAQVHGADLYEQAEFGLLHIQVLEEDKLIKKELKEIYSVHSKAFTIPKGWTCLAKTSCPQVIRKENHYAILFHPEVRNKELIRSFLKL